MQEYTITTKLVLSPFRHYGTNFKEDDVLEISERSGDSYFIHTTNGKKLDDFWINKKTIHKHTMDIK